MKEQDQNHQDNETQQAGSPKYWLSLEDWRKDPEFIKLAENEFKSSPLFGSDRLGADQPEGNHSEGGWARREFLKLMGASMALTSFGCIRRPAQKIVPYVNRPEEVVPGVQNYYASSYVDGQVGYGIVVTTREGRPIKVEGNPEHPINRGGMSARAHAHILELYDPDRLTGPISRANKDAGWEGVDADVAAALKQGKVTLLTGSITSPATGRLLGEFKKAFGANHYKWDSDSYADEREAQRICYGKSVLPRPRIDKAKYIVSFGADFLGTYLSPVEFTKDFGAGRKPGDNMNKLVAFEPVISLTGANADERYRVRASQMLELALAVGAKLAAKKGSSSDELKDYGSFAGLDAAVVDKVVDELWANRGKSLVLTGGLSVKTADSVKLHIATNYINSLLGNDGKTIDHSNVTYTGGQGSDADLAQLIADMKSGKVSTLVIQGVNPAYSSAQAANFAEAVKKVKTVVYVGRHDDETAKLAGYVASDHHSMEAWGDQEVQTGVFSIQQPTIRPLHDTRSFQESLITWMTAAGKASSEGSWYEYLRSYWGNNIHSKNRKGIASGNFDSFWYELLQAGVFDTTSGKRNSSGSSREFSSGALAKAFPSQRASAEGFELVLYSTVGLADGSLANVSWLQEFPDPVAKICWDNYLCVSPKTAHDSHLKEGQFVKIKAGDQEVTAPVHIQPGHHDNVYGLAVGYGRTEAGQVANGVGVNAYPLAQASKDGGVVFAGASAELSATDKYDTLAAPQGHNRMEGRQIVVEATLKQFSGNPAAGIHRHEKLIDKKTNQPITMWQAHEYPGRKWGMTIDLNSCTGCSACMIACQSENNIPTVGKKHVIDGREMHWIRLDRYYTGDPNEPGAVYMPMLCQHCDNAPCETVCPVAATTHGEEGTNDMIYNRCVGTRYCANNCPYKVRRFNWFDYTHMKAPLEMALNPEVTVRARGVMEKCTFCMHRIKDAKFTAKVEGRTLKESDVTTACAQSCPTNAITFGNTNDPESAVSKSKADPRGYYVLEELNNLPAVQYQSKIRNTDHLKADPGAHHGEEGGHA